MHLCPFCLLHMHLLGTSNQSIHNLAVLCPYYRSVRAERQVLYRINLFFKLRLLYLERNGQSWITPKYLVVFWESCSTFFTFSRKFGRVVCQQNWISWLFPRLILIFQFSIHYFRHWEPAKGTSRFFSS